MDNKIKSGIFNIILIAVILLISYISIYMIKPPCPVSKNAKTTNFSSERAMNHIRAISKKPHSIGTDEHKGVRDYIIDETRKLGLKTEVHKETTNYYYRKDKLLSAYVENIVAVLKGKEEGKKVFIVGHYDSQPNTLGAADDGIALGSMLETARALKEFPQFKNDIVFLFTDSEENGLLGAHAFVQHHPLANDIGIIFNFEARGNYGPSFMFEVGPENGWIIREFAKITPYPFAGSIFYEAYKLLPNNTDFTVFKEKGHAGFNAAVVDGFDSYHSMTDTPENLNPGSLQHTGSYMINFAKHFGNQNLDKTRADDVVYFNPIGSWLIVFSKTLLYILTLIATILFIIYLVMGTRSKRLTPGGIIGSLGINIMIIASIACIIFLFQIIITHIYPHYNHFYKANFYNIKYYFVFFSALTVMLYSGIYNFIFNKMKSENNSAGAIVTAFLLLIAITIGLPTASYQLTITLIFILIAHISNFVYDFSEDNKREVFGISHLIAIIPAICIFSSLIYLLFVVFAMNTPIIATFFLMLLLGFMLPHFKLLTATSRILLPGAAFLVAIIAFIGGHLTSGYSKEQPLQSSVAYCIDADMQKAMWVSRFSDLDEWNKQFFKESKIYSIDENPIKGLYLSIGRKKDDATRLVSDAPMFNIPLPIVNIKKDTVVDARREVTFTIKSQRNAPFIKVAIPISIGLNKVIINGREVKDEKYYSIDDKKTHFIYFKGFHERMMEVVLQCDSKEPFDITLKETKLGLPDFEGIKPMPESIIPDTDGESYAIIQVKRYRINKKD